MEELKESSRKESSNHPQKKSHRNNGRSDQRWYSRNHRQQQPARQSVLPPDFPIYQFQQMTKLKVSQLQAIAKAEGVRHYWSTPRKQLIMEIYKQQLRRGAKIRHRGVVELTPENHAYLRSEELNLQANIADPFIPVQIIKQHHLYGGLEVAGELRQPRSGDRHLVMNQIDHVEGMPIGDFSNRTPFEKLTALFPVDRLFLEVANDPDPDLSRRVIDLITPIGKGQRGLIIAPPRVGKTILMKKMILSIEKNHPEAHVIVLLIDERPEEVTDIRESIKGSVVASTFDENPNRHIRVATTALNRAKVLVENGKDVVLFLDSITRLARAYNSSSGNSGRLMSGGIDSAALQKTKQFFGTARNIENGGSLTILGTALVHTGSRMDQMIYEEFKGTGNMDLYLDRDIANSRIYPALNIQISSTRKDDLLMPKDEFEIVTKVRKHLSQMTPIDAITRLLEQLRKYKSNAEFLMAIRNSLG